MPAVNAEQLWAWLLARSHVQATLRILYLYGNFGGNLLGDTIIATQHLEFFSSIPNSDLTVWTSESAVWNALSGRKISCKPFITPQEISNDFDFIFIDWCRVGPDFRHALEESRSALLLWESRAGSACWRTPDGCWQKVTLPAMANQTTRILQLYEALNWPRTHMMRSKEARPKGIYFNPFASTARKSLPVSAISGLGNKLCAIAANDSVMVAPLPVSMTSHDATQMQAIQVALHSAFNREHTRFLKQMPIEEYFGLVAQAQLVISPDTSTQHIAGLFQVPSITFYRASTGFNWYFWGWSNPKSFSIRLSETEEHDDELSLAGHIINHMIAPCSQSPFENANCIHALIVEFQSKIDNMTTLSGNGRNHSSLLALLRDINNQMKSRWTEPLKMEILQVCREVAAGTYSTSISDEDFACRIRNFNAIRITNFLCTTDSRLEAMP